MKVLKYTESLTKKPLTMRGKKKFPEFGKRMLLNKSNREMGSNKKGKKTVSKAKGKINSFFGIFK